jgi:hypothetical protein
LIPIRHPHPGTYPVVEQPEIEAGMSFSPSYLIVTVFHRRLEKLIVTELLMKFSSFC